MRQLLLLALLNLSLFSFSQEDTEQWTRPIVEEGKRLYNSEMASWYGTDVFLAKYKRRENVGGYFSYSDKGVSKCIFFSREEKPKVIGTISFEKSFDVKDAKLDLSERTFTAEEQTYYVLRTKAIETISSDTLFKRYEHTNLNVIPMLSEGKRKVYVLTGPEKGGVVILGNDYLLLFDENNNLVSQKALHQNIIQIKTESEGGEERAEETMHTHLPQTGDFITATDICTLMLYAKYTPWKQHSVISAHYLSIWNCKTGELFTLSKEVLDKISKDGEKRRGK